MSKFSTVSTIEAAAGRRDQILPLLAAHKARCLKEEPGTLQFEILLPNNDDEKILLYEVYRDAARLMRIGMGHPLLDGKKRPPEWWRSFTAQGARYLISRSNRRGR